MKILLLLVVVATAPSQADSYSSIPSLSGIVCQLFLGGIPLCPASSCKEVADTTLWRSRSGLHWLTSDNGTIQAYCSQYISPSKSRGWMRVGYIHSGDGCPAELGEVTAGGKKLCAKTVDVGCSSVIFPTHGVSYSKVCGRVYGYQKDSPDGHERHTFCPGCTIDQPYVDGVSITHGSPREHIWTLAASGQVYYCPCSASVSAPSFVGDDHFCDVEGKNTYTYNDRLWDGYDCVSGAERCCDRANQSRGWMRAGYVYSGNGCPAGLGEVTAGSKKLCAKTVHVGCSSVTFPTHGVSYSKVCGLVYGYNNISTDGFYRYAICSSDCTIDQPYVDGVSITHGSPRQHIWTLAASQLPTQ